MVQEVHLLNTGVEYNTTILYASVLAFLCLCYIVFYNILLLPFKCVNAQVI